MISFFIGLIVVVAILIAITEHILLINIICIILILLCRSSIESNNKGIAEQNALLEELYKKRNKLMGNEDD